ncbi:hypothetical protein NW762_010441 [Fusarium torreyae]|uniref:Helicase required for RNAi-mediated heterochromatin assembly 1 n=1 Tax=Fusarium torreyae TaxID=1237075 RepID=A0A9W8VD74_9HYPO|nr:hypothetical protein NW762_010441 [Fusarium torreyae]
MATRHQVSRDQSALEIITDHVMSRQLLAADGQDWRSSAEFPQPGEVMAFDPAPLPQGPQEDEPFKKNEYLEFQYALNRIEGTELLRQAVNQFRNDPTMMEDNDFYIYSQVHVQGYLFAKSGPACRISFSTERSPTRVAWHQSTRLTAGTLVALSPRSDGFTNQCFVAVVAARYLLGGLEPNPEDGEDENTPPRIEIFWSNCDTAIFDPSIEMVMLEAKGGYYETVRHAMVGLQHAANFESKFDKYIIDGSTKECNAAYLADTWAAETPASASLFDPSQKEAFDRMTSRELAVVQGPPGTGKTFTSVQALKSFVLTLKAGRGKDEAVPPVLVAAQTNHALDQLLGRCSSFDAVIARLGGRTEDEKISTRTLYNIRMSSKLRRGPTQGENARKKVLSQIEKVLSDCFPPFLITAEQFRQEELISREQYESLDDDEWESADMVDSDENGVAANSIAQWLDGCIESDQTYVYRPPTEQVEAPVDNGEDPDGTKQNEENDKERLRGEFFDIKFHVTGSVPGALSTEAAWYYQAKKLLAKHSNLYNIKPPQRGMVYRCLRKQLIDSRAGKFPQLLKEYQATCNEVKVSRWMQDVKIIHEEKIEILGCTTTGLTKYRGLIAALKPQILMIEEAAETREANISSALYPTLDQIVLVGDHQQLVPQVDTPGLNKAPYNMNVSLFERLVKLKLPYTMLQVQRRMVPAIREVVNTFYLKLTDHPSVNDLNERPLVPGMGGKSLWWYHHNWAEIQNLDDYSFSNPHEADMIVRFVRYLVQNGVLPNEITMLSFYKGQVTLLVEKLRRDPVLMNVNPTREWSVRTVDGFQGEENDVILLSLVRSDRPGFVANENRAVVATSRAKCGMYIFGNAFNLLDRTRRSYRTWSKVYNVFVDNKCIDTFLPVTCKNHGQVTRITDLATWDTIPGAGCDHNCEETCPQGHRCRTTCHPFEQSKLKCQERCEKILDCGHSCGSLCWDRCECSQKCRQAPAVVLPIRTPRLPLSSNIASQAPRGGKAGRGRGKTGRGGKLQKVHSKIDSQLASNDSRGDQVTPEARVQNRELTLKQTVVAARTQDATIGYHLDPFQTVQDLHREPTSEELMQMGYYSHMSERAKTSIIQPDYENHSTPKFEGTAASLTEDSMSDKWSPEKVSRHDEALKKLARRNGQKSPCPTVIKETYRQTSAANGHRVCGPASFTKYTIPAPSLNQFPRGTSSETSASAEDASSRKRLLFDAAAGGYPDNSFYSYATGEGESAKLSSESEVDEGMDLISFE